MNILVIKQTSLGDVLHSTAALEMIKNNFPKAHLTYLIDKSCAEIIAQNPFVDKMVTIDLKRLEKRIAKWYLSPLLTFQEVWKEWKFILSQLRIKKYEYAIDFQGLFRSAIFFYFVKAKIKITKSYFPFLQFYKNKKIHAIDEMKQILKKVGLEENSKQPTQMAYFFKNKANKKIEIFCNILKKMNRPILVISPFTRWENKNWSIENYVKLIERLADYKMNIVLSATVDKIKIIEELIAKLPLKNQKNKREIILNKATLFNLTGELSIDDFARLVEKSDLHLSSDSFPMHLSSALKKKQIALFAPTREEKVGPRNKHAVVLRDKDCRRCYQRNCKEDCIDRIGVEKVCSEVVSGLELNINYKE